MRKRQRLRQRPTIGDMLKSFRNIDSALAKLADGWIYAEKEVAVFQFETGGEWFEIAPAIRGWVDAFGRILNHYKQEIDLSALSELADDLEQQNEIEPGKVEKCQAAVNACKKAYRSMDIYEIHRIAKTASIAIYMEEQERKAA